MSAPPVPYFSQWESPDLVKAIVTGAMSAADDPRWPESGAVSAREYEFWSWRICGMACLRMLLAQRGQAVPPSVELAKECERFGGYVQHENGVRGLIYAPFLSWVADRFGLTGEVRVDFGVPELRNLVSQGHPVIASVHQTIREPKSSPPARGGHLVLVTAVDESGLYINNPSGFSSGSQHGARVEDEDFERFYAMRAMVFDRTG
ncbi:C39 family peptidase [Amycolatopsis sp. cmx-11-12]|uniref:C39 family peptidase n=1 Tax=Amycolatopsis sp. cmx-11-12 TaxID=2785795 RepID=UPI003917565C